MNTSCEEIRRYFRDYVKFTHAIDTTVQSYLGEVMTQEELEELYSGAVEKAMELDLRLHFIHDHGNLTTTLHDYCHELKNLLDIDFIEIAVNPHEIRLNVEGCPFASKFHYKATSPQVCPMAIFIAMIAKKYLDGSVKFKHMFNEKGMRCRICLEEV